MITLRSSRDKNWFGRRLKAAHEAARISQEELAERVDLTRLTIARYEAESAEAKRGEKRAAEILRQSILEILGDRFGELSPSVGLHFKEIDDLARLQDLLKKSATARNLSRFLHELTRET